MELNESQLEKVIGPVAMREYRQAEDWDQAEIREWAAGLQGLSDQDFVLECGMKVHDSALMQSFRGNHEGTHARASACYHEAKRRHEAAGHAKDCRGDTLYTEGFNVAYRSQGHTPSPPYPCTCGKEGEKL